MPSVPLEPSTLTSELEASIALDGSRHLRRLIEANPQLIAELKAPAPSGEEIAHWLAGAEALNDEALQRLLRQGKQRLFARLVSRDLLAGAPLSEIVVAMSTYAEQAISCALAVAERSLIERYGVPRNSAGREQKLIVIGMGKLGGRELNVSSDIDLIFVYPEDGETDGGRAISNFEFFTRLGRLLIKLLAEVTADGQVFRVDMRLRPNGDSGPLAASFDMLENYFIAQGREWERYAWIKARPLTGERHDELEAIRRPFVFRRYLDFATIDAMRALHAQIRREVARKEMADNIKLGPGGIREIEFIAQVFQLIRGGRDLALQIRPTLAVLNLLVERGQLSLDAGLELAAAYDFLRRLEHRLQYLDDAQTHSLPENDADRTLIAQAMGYTRFDALLAELDDHRSNVSRHFEAVFAEREASAHDLDAVWADAESQCARLGELGFRQPEDTCQRLKATRSSSCYRQLSEAARARFDLLVPRLMRAATTTRTPDATLARGLDLLEAIGRRGAYLALLVESPQALQRVAELAAASRWGAEYLRQHPVLLDELLDNRLLEAEPDWSDFAQQLAEQMRALEPDTERQMDVMREAHHAWIFRLLARDLAGALSLERLSDHLSYLADGILQVTLPTCWGKLLKRHREAPRFAIIGYGKLGGKELGYASDLDLVFLFDDQDDAASQVYAKLAMRICTWLATQTSAGQLFEVDTRLRPNGEAGLIVVSTAAFRDYQLKSAWTWEHQALTRARFCAGDAAVGEQFETIRREILLQERDAQKLRDDVLAMRRKMLDTHGSKSELFDLKQDRGGLIDVEFIVQYLILAHAHAVPELCGNLGNIALLGIAAQHGLIDAELAQATQQAYRHFRRLQHTQRLNSEASRVTTEVVASEAVAVRALWQEVFGETAD